MEGHQVRDRSVPLDRPWLDWQQTPRTAFIPPTPPGPEGSKGTRALSGVRGVLLPPR